MKFFIILFLSVASCAGAVGQQGQKGDQGQQGIQGPQGPTGSQGPQGEPGIQGPQGIAGPRGPVGQDGNSAAQDKMVSSLYCSAQLQNTSLTFYYWRDVFLSGDVFVDGCIQNDLFETCNSSFFSASQNGASTGFIAFVQDDDATANGGWWSLSYDKSVSVITVVYTDADVTNGSTTWTLTQNQGNCVQNSY